MPQLQHTANPESRSPKTSLDDIETNVERPLISSNTSAEDATERELGFRHAGWAPTRRLVLSVFDKLWRADAIAKAEGRSYNQGTAPRPVMSLSRLDAIESCGGTAWLMQSKADPTRFKVSCNRCHDRFCIPCAGERAFHIRSKLHEKITCGVQRFITLTLRHTDSGLREQLDHLYQSFRRLRQRTAWKETVEGGIAFCEIKWSVKSQKWHPHLHILCHGKYLPQKTLADEWYAATGTSWMVDIRIVKDTHKVAEYVSKYVTKGYDRSVYATESVLAEAATALHGRRCVLTFGDWRGFVLNEKTTDEGWEVIERLSSLIRRAATGDETARLIVRALRAQLTEEQQRLDFERAPPVDESLACMPAIYDPPPPGLFPKGLPTRPTTWATEA